MSTVENPGEPTPQPSVPESAAPAVEASATPSPATPSPATPSPATPSPATLAPATPSPATPSPAPMPLAPRKLHHGDALGTGRRKTSVARVRIRAGKGEIRINGRTLEEYFPILQDQGNVLAPLLQTERRNDVDVVVKVHGGGISGQSGACKLGIARALKIFDTSLEPALRQVSLLTRDSRMKERKKYGLRGARRGTQFSKR